MKMTNEQINAAIAKACGWKHVRGYYWKNPNGLLMFEWDMFDYCNDLNAMHEAEKTIFPYYGTVYSNKLAKVTGAEMSDDTDYFCATARQRAEAFLRTLGKWKETTDKESLTVGNATTEGSSADHVCGITENCEVSILENNEPEKPRAVQKICSGLNVIEAFQQLKPAFFIRRAIWKNNTKLPSGIAFTSLSPTDITTNDWEVWGFLKNPTKMDPAGKCG